MAHRLDPGDTSCVHHVVVRRELLVYPELARWLPHRVLSLVLFQRLSLRVGIIGRLAHQHSLAGRTLFTIGVIDLEVVADDHHTVRLLVEEHARTVAELVEALPHGLASRGNEAVRLAVEVLHGPVRAALNILGGIRSHRLAAWNCSRRRVVLDIAAVALID